MQKIKNVTIRRILNSAGGDAYEAEVELEGGYTGIASSPVAIEPGHREKKTTGNNFSHLCIEKIKNCFISQYMLDNYLQSHMDKLGSDITLSISMAFARASSRAMGASLVEYLKSLLEVKVKERFIMPLVPIFSGGIHDCSLGGSIQQIMIGVKGLEFGSSVYVIRSIYREVERILTKNSLLKGLAASSGFLVKSLTVDEEFVLLESIIQQSEWRENLFIAIDVAAEHLWENGRYKFYNEYYSPEDFEELLFFFTRKYSISIIEDPFAYHDVGNWKSLYDRIGDSIEILADDYSATQVQYLDGSISDGIIVKMKQVGTLSATLHLISKIKSMGLKTCVSHRSCETEDTFICDLAVAIDSDYIKIGAPCRGDRVEKYNQLLRLYGLNIC